MLQKFERVFVNKRNLKSHHTYIYLATLPTLPIKLFCYNFKTAQDIEMKIAGTMKNFKRRVLKAK